MFRLTINPALEKGDNTFSITYLTIDEVISAENYFANFLLFLQDELKIMPDYSNYFFKEKKVDGKWVEIE